jgi:hypothetical protein
MTALLGNHLKLQVAEEYRDRVRSFYADVLGWSAIPAPAPDLFLFQIPDGEIVGVFFVPADQALTEAQHLAGTWLEIMTDDVDALLARLRTAGVKEIEYFDKTHFYFQSPGGPVFRLAPESER